jgi:hypothetical protein
MENTNERDKSSRTTYDGVDTLCAAAAHVAAPVKRARETFVTVVCVKCILIESEICVCAERREHNMNVTRALAPRKEQHKREKKQKTSQDHSHYLLASQRVQFRQQAAPRCRVAAVCVATRIQFAARRRRRLFRLGRRRRSRRRVVGGAAQPHVIC